MHVAYLLHAFLAAFLFLEELALAAHVASVALCQHVLAHLLHRLAGDDLGSDGGLYGDVELLARQELLQLLAHAAAEGLGIVEVGQRGEGVDRFAVEQDVHLDELAGAVAVLMVVEGGIALADALQLVVEVDDDFPQGHGVLQLYAVAADVFLLEEFAALAQAERHDGTDEVGRRDDGGMDVGLLDVVDERLVGHAAGVVHLGDVALLVVDEVRDVGDGGDDVHVELAVEPFLDDFHVEQSEESAAETEAEGHGAFGLEGEAGIVELQLLERGAEVLEVLRLDGIDACEDHRFHLLEACNGLLAGVLHGGDGVAHLDFRCRLDAGDDVAHVAARQRLPGHHVHLQHTYLVGLVLLAGIDELHHVAAPHRAVHDLEVGDDAAEGVEHGVEDEGLQGSLLVALGTGNALHHSPQDVLHAHARLAAGAYDFLALAADEVHDFVLHLVGHRIGHVALVDDGNDFQVVVDGHVEVADGLRLHALRSVHDEQGTLAGSDAAAHLVAEVHVSRRVDEIEDVLLPPQAVLHLYGVALDGDAALLFQVHIVEHLPLGHGYGLCVLQQTVCQSALPVVDVGNDAEVANVLH